MAGCSIINYKGQDIVYADHRKLNGSDLLENLKKANKILGDYKGDKLLLLADFNETVVDNDIMEYLRSDETKEVNKRVTKTAVLGIAGIKKIFLNSFNIITGNKARAFDNEIDAKEYLVS